MAIFKKKTEAKVADVKPVKSVKPVKKVAEAKPAKVEKVAKEEKKTVAVELSATQKNRGLDLAMVLIRPHVTEKATDLSEKGCYAFEVNKLANKMAVKLAIEKYYKVSPRKIAIINGKPKLMKNPRTNRVQVKKTGDKKALVYLKSGDKIEFV